LRSRKTNALQVAVLLAGIIFIITGAAFFYSPMAVFRLFVSNISDTWLDLTRDNELIAPMYHTLRAFAALLITSGMAMVMPLFDPLKYRLMIYFNGVIFPFFASLMLIKTGFSLGIRLNMKEGAFQGNYVHKSMIVFGFIFAFIFFSCLITLFITRKDAKEGKE